MATKRKKERLRRSREAGQNEICELGKQGFSVEKLNDYQFRVNDAVDLYPTSRKFHILGTNERGRYDNLQTILDKVKS